MRFYTLFFLFLFCSCSFRQTNEIEPNNSRYDAQLIKIPINISGVIEDEKDTDCFKFIVEQTNKGNILLKTSAIGPLEMSLFFHGECIKKFHRIEEQNNNQIIFNNIFFQKGIYYIKVNGYEGQVKEQSYNLLLNQEALDAIVENEPNDQLVQANIIDLVHGLIKGYFCPAYNFAYESGQYQESDWFMFNSAEPSNILSVELTSVPDIDSVLELYNQMGYLLKVVDSGGIEEPEILKNLGISDIGNYYVKVYNKNLPAQNNDVPYQLYIKFNQRDPLSEYENNDLFNSANVMQQTIKGYINPIGDKDYFTFDVMNEVGLFNFSLTPINYIDLKLEIFNSYREKIYTLNSASINEGEIIPNILLKKGTYYISISDVSNKRQNYTDEYTLKIIQKNFNLN